MNLRRALIQQAPSLALQRAALQRAAADEIARLDAQLQTLLDAVWKACGDDKSAVAATLDAVGYEHA